MILSAVHARRGMSLIEVMVAMVVLGITGAALTGLFLASGRDTAMAHHEVDAANLAQEIMEQVKSVPENQLGAAQEGTTTTIRLGFTAGEVDDFYNGMTIALTGGKGAGQVRKVVDYNGATRTITVDRRWDSIPDSTTTYVVFKGVDSGYTYKITVVPHDDLITVTVAVRYPAMGGRIREVSLTSERLGGWRYVW